MRRKEEERNDKEIKEKKENEKNKKQLVSAPLVFRVGHTSLTPLRQYHYPRTGSNSIED